MVTGKVVNVTSTTPLPASRDFVEICTRSSQVLWEIALKKSALDDSLGSLACATGSELIRFQGILWESLVVNAGSSYRKYFQFGEKLTQTLASLDSDSHSTIAHALLELRSQLEMLVVEAGIHDYSDSMQNVSAFEMVTFPDRATIESDVARRLEGQNPKAYAHKQNQKALKLSVQAFTAQSSGDVNEAIRLMYASEFTFLDAYLVESAHAAGDHDLFTVRTRWELATYSASLINQLPQDLAAATVIVRSAVTDLLGAQDAVRLVSALPAV